MDSRLLGATKYQTFCSILAALANVNFGWNNAVINIPGDAISKCVTGPKHYDGPFPSCIPTSATVWGVSVGVYPLGSVVGALSCGYFSNKYGRKPTLLYGNIFTIVGALLLATTTSLAQFILGRFVIGIQVGIATACVSTYIGEITTAKARTVLGSMLQLACNLGIFISEAFGLGLSKPPLWRVLFSISAVIAIVAMLGFSVAVESPRWLVSHGHIEEAEEALQRLRKGADIKQELQDLIDASNQAENGEVIPPSTVTDLLMNRTPDNLRHQLITINMMMVLQQFSGINAVVFYSTRIFDSISNDDPANIPTLSQILTCVMSLVSFLFTFLGMWMISRFGRRPMMIFSHGSMAVSSLMMVVGSVKNIQYLVIVFVFLFNITFMLAAGPLPWAAAAEMTPSYAMSAMTAIGNSVNFLFAFIIGLMFPPLQDALGDYTFLFFMAWNIVACVVMFFFLPETRNRRVEDVVRVHSTGFHIVLGRNVPTVNEVQDVEVKEEYSKV